MAEIPVEKKSSASSSWIWWLLLLAGIIALLWWLFAEAGEDEDLESDVVAVEAVDTTTGDATGGATAITGLAGLAGLGDMIGREVELSGVAVNEVVGDMGFTVGEGDNETLVMWDEPRTPDTPMEGNVDVNPGSQVTVTGTVREYAGNVPESVSSEIAANTEAMMFASNVDVVE